VGRKRGAKLRADEQEPRIEGGADQGERAMNRKTLVIKGQAASSRSEKSAEVVLAKGQAVEATTAR